MLTVQELIELLDLKPLPREGGFFRETWRSMHTLSAGALPPGYDGARPVATAIYYLLTPDVFSALHRLRGDEIYHFYLGDPVEFLELSPDGGVTTTRLGQNLQAGMQVQHVVPGGHWQGARLVEGGRYALLGTTMAPGFSFEDFEPGDAAALSLEFPDLVNLIRALCAT